jgi:hypothetical protein
LSSFDALAGGGQVSPPQPTESFIDKEQCEQITMLERATIHAISWSRMLEGGRKFLKQLHYFDTLSRLRVITKTTENLFQANKLPNLFQHDGIYRHSPSPRCQRAGKILPNGYHALPSKGICGANKCFQVSIIVCILTSVRRLVR